MMNGIAEGFAHQRLLVLTDALITSLRVQPLTGDLYITDIGFFPEARQHYRERPQGSKAWIFTPIIFPAFFIT